MLRFLVTLSFASVLFCAGCWSSASSDAGANGTDANLQVAEVGDAESALTEGTRLLDEGEIDPAIDALSRAVKIDPDLAIAWFRLGIAYALAEKRDETLVDESNTDSGSAKRSKPNSEKAFEKAVAAYNKIIDANDQDHVAYFNLGRSYNKLNEDQDAAKALKQAAKLNPEDTDYQTELGAILIKLAQYHEAIAPLKKALEIDPENIRAQELLEDAMAGRSRVNYTSTPKPDKSPTPSANSNTNANVSPGDPTKPPPPSANSQTKPRPTPTRPE